MVSMTIKIDDKVARVFRAHVKKKYGTKKGALGKAVTDALENQSKRGTYSKEFLSLLENGHSFGGSVKFTRDELYDRN